MAKKKRVLLVEDVASSRKAYKSRLELEGYSVTAAANLEDAKAAVDARTFHVALVDIMLDGPKNTANRDGVEVIKHINNLDEGTLVIPLTGQGQKSFVRDTFKELGVFDFLDKHEDITTKGWDFAVSRIEAAISRSELDDTPEWSDFVKNTLHPEEEQVLVSNVSALTDGVKFEIFTRLLSAAIREFQPLVGVPGGDSAFSLNQAEDCVTGEFWSKSHGRAVSIQIRKASNGNGEPIKDADLFVRTKSKVSVAVRPLEGKKRMDFNH